MGMHVIGRKCMVCGHKGLIVGADDRNTFRPQGWLLQRLSARQLACAHCGVMTLALIPQALKKLQAALRDDRRTERVTYHARPAQRRPA
jgi:hypothetical protein